MGRAWRRGVLVLGALGAFGLGGAWHLLTSPLPDGLQPCFDLPSGASAGELTSRLAPRLAPPTRLALQGYLRLSGAARALKAGEYCLSPGTTPRSLVTQVREGKVHQRTFQILEGWTLRDLEAALTAAPRLDRAPLASGWAERAEQLGRSGSLEGRFFPDSYAYTAGSSALALLAQAASRMDRLLEAAWVQREPTEVLPSPEALLILASLVEKETGQAADRPRVARVFHNRLREGMRLQTDVSVIYGLGPAFNGDLTRADLRRDTPYNSYRRRGLPPTPIAFPGRAALEAAARPAPGPWRYFVARGDGTSEFSVTLKAHEEAVDRFQRRQRTQKD